MHFQIVLQSLKKDQRGLSHMKLISGSKDGMIS